jgi:hypothetical protein
LPNALTSTINLLLLSLCILLCLITPFTCLYKKKMLRSDLKEDFTISTNTSTFTFPFLLRPTAHLDVVSVILRFLHLD